MTNGTTQHTPADVRGRIIRASILPFEDVETMIAGLRAGAEAVERGELDVDDFVGVWSQYLRQLLRASSVPAPADMERLRQMYFDLADRILAILRRTSRAEEEAWCAFLDALDEFEAAAASLWADPEGPTAEDMERLDRDRQRVIECGRALASIRPEAQEEEDVGEFCHLCGEEFDPRESGTVTGPLGQDDGVPRWYRCPRCARAYDAGYQQGQRDPRGDETADPTALRSEAPVEGEADALELLRWAESQGAALEPVVGNIMPPGTYACYVGDNDDPYMGPGILGAIRAALRSEAQGDDHWEDLVFGPITEAYHEAHAAEGLT